MAEAVKDNIKSIGLPIVSASLQPIDMGTNIHIKRERGYLTLFIQILAALEASRPGIIFFLEHDNLYDPSHFEFTPPRKDQFYYDVNWWKIRKDGLAVHWDAAQVSGLCCYRDAAIDWYRQKVESFNSDNFDRKFEPPGDDTHETWKAEVPYIDIRHQTNLTYNKWKLDHFRKKETAVNFETSTIDKIPGWEAGLLRSIL